MNLKELQNKFGIPQINEYGNIPFRCYSLNLLLGGKGIPRNTFTEISGEESSGKTTLGLELLEQATLQNCITFIADQEKQIDDNRLAKFNLFRGENCIITRAHFIEELFDWLDNIVAELRKNKDTRPIVGLIDSVGVMVPQAIYNITDPTESGNPGVTAKAWGNQLKRWLAKQNDYNITLIFLNHQNELFQPPGRMPWGTQKQTTTPGGRTFKHLMHTRLQINKGAIIKNGHIKIGNEIYVKTLKTRTAPPFQSVKLPLYFGNPNLPPDKDYVGTHDGIAALYHLKELNVITHSGSKSKLKCLTTDNKQIELSWTGMDQWINVFNENKQLIYSIMSYYHYATTNIATLNDNDTEN